MTLTRQFKEIAIKMYSILFEEEKPRVYRTVQQEVKKENNKKRGKRVLSDNSHDEEDGDNSEFSQSEYTNSRQSSIGKLDSH